MAVLRETQGLLLRLLLRLLEAGPAWWGLDGAVDAIRGRSESGWVAEGGYGRWFALEAGACGSAPAESGVDFVADAKSAFSALQRRGNSEC